VERKSRLLDRDEARKKAVYLRLVDEVINDGRFDGVEDLFTPDYVDHARPHLAPVGIAGIRIVPRRIRYAFPNIRLTVEDIIGEGDLTAARVTARGTHLRPFRGIEPTGLPVEWTIMDFFRFRDGKVAERWGTVDSQILLEQLGGIPSPPREPPEYLGLTPEQCAELAGLERCAPDPEASKAIYRHYIEKMFNRHDLSELRRWLAPGYAYRFMGQTVRGIEGYEARVFPFLEAFPDARKEVLQIIAEGERVAALWRLTGTHLGRYEGVVPTGIAVEYLGITFERIRGGRRLQGWGCADLAGLLGQIGAIPPKYASK
jgi:predicted ester cyclase